MLLGDQWLLADLGVADPAADADLERGARLGAVGRQVGEADADAERRRQRAGRHDAAADHRVALAGDARAGDRERDEPLGGALRAVARDALVPDEARRLLARPAEAGLDRAAVLGQVVAVEVEADLEPQRVAGAEAGRPR